MRVIIDSPHPTMIFFFVSLFKPFSAFYSWTSLLPFRPLGGCLTVRGGVKRT